MSRFCNVLYFKHVIENALDGFFSSSSKDFRVEENGLIVLSRKSSSTALKKDLKARIVSEIKRYVRPYDVLTGEYFFLLGSCYPKDNFLLGYLDEKRYFPEKIRKYIEDGTIKYFLKTDGIRIDLSSFNSVFEEIFDEFFSRKGFKRYFPNNTKNLFFLKYRGFDCYMMYRTLKMFFGRVNVCNMREKNMKTLKSNLYSVNNRIDDYSVGIKSILEKGERKREVEEIFQFLRNCIGNEVK